MTIKERYAFFLNYFAKAQPDASSELNYGSPFELLVAVILSAQCTDKRVNMVTPSLMKAFPTPQAMAAATVEDIYEQIKSISYPNNKSKHLSGMAKQLVERYNGIVPDTVEELQTLPGVGRKTANVVTAVLWNQPNMPVDTHVFRVSARIGLTNKAKTPFDTEKQLVKHIPAEQIPVAHHWLILHGRYVCLARKPKCEQCPITTICRYYALQQKKTTTHE